MGKRRLDDGDIDAFMDAAERRMRPITRDEIREHMRRKNGWRWWRLQHDYRWLRKQMKKLGLNPDDARELL